MLLSDLLKATTSYEGGFMIKLRYTWWWFLSDKCNSCCELAGIEKGKGLKSIFTNECKLRSILMKNDFDISKLTFIDNGWAYLDRTIVVDAYIRSLKQRLNHHFTFKLFKEYEEFKAYQQRNIEYVIDRMFFVNPSVNPTFSISMGVLYLPAVISPFAQMYLEEGIHPATPTSELEKCLFGGEYRLVYHEKREKGAEPIWAYVFERKMKLPYTRPRPYTTSEE